jgi:hypothetical protein
MSAICPGFQCKVEVRDSGCPEGEISRSRSHSRYSFNTSYSFDEPSSMVEYSSRDYVEEDILKRTLLNADLLVWDHLIEKDMRISPNSDRVVSEVIRPQTDSSPAHSAINKWNDLDAEQRDRFVRANIPLGLCADLCAKISKVAKPVDPYLFEELCQSPINVEVDEMILKDVGRTFQNETVKGMQTKLYCVLKAYSLYDRRVGYCQVRRIVAETYRFLPVLIFICKGLNYLAGTLLMVMSAEESFWILVVLLMRKGPYRLQSMFLRGTPQVVVCLYCLDRLTELFLPKLFSHFKEVKISPILFATPWFATLYSYTFPFEFTAVIWTIFLQSGKVILFRVAMAILKLMETNLLQLGFEECMFALKEAKCLQVRDVVQEADKFCAIDEKFVTLLKKEAIEMLKTTSVSDLL